MNELRIALEYLKCSFASVLQHFYVAHQIALELLHKRREATISQLPMLALMVAFTVAGLWILSQPIRVAP